MSTNRKKILVKRICTASVGCGCAKPKLSDVYEPKPKPKSTSISNSTTTPQNPSSSSSTSIEKSNNDEPYKSSESETDLNPAKPLTLCSKIVDSVAVVKESNDPYRDFRRSMMRMIREKEICSQEELRELLNRFLDLNSPVHHDVIVKAFTEISN